MAKLNYTNLFVVTANGESQEIILRFFQEYPEFQFLEDNTELNRTAMNREEVASVALTKENACKLLNIIHDSLQQLANHQKGNGNV